MWGGVGGRLESSLFFGYDHRWPSWSGSVMAGRWPPTFRRPMMVMMMCHLRKQNILAMLWTILPVLSFAKISSMKDLLQNCASSSPAGQTVSPNRQPPLPTMMRHANEIYENDDIQFPSLISGEDLENWREDWNWRPIKLHLEWIRQPDATQQPASNGQTPETGGCDANHTIKAQQSKPETLSLSLHRRRRRGIHSHLLRFGYSIVGISASCTPNPILSSRTIEREVVVGLRSPARRE